MVDGTWYCRLNPSCADFDCDLCREEAQDWADRSYDMEASDG